MTRAQLLTGTLLDGASPMASVGRCDMLGLTGPVSTLFLDWAERLPDSPMPYGGRTGRVYVDGVERGVITMGGMLQR